MLTIKLMPNIGRGFCNFMFVNEFITCGIFIQQHSSTSNEHFDTAQCTWLEVCNMSHPPVYVYNILNFTTMDKPRGTKAACGISLKNQQRTLWHWAVHLAGSLQYESPPPHPVYVVYNILNLTTMDNQRKTKNSDIKLQSKHTLHIF